MRFDPEYWKNKVREAEEVVEKLGVTPLAKRTEVAVQLLILDRLDSILNKMPS